MRFVEKKHVGALLALCVVLLTACQGGISSNPNVVKGLDVHVVLDSSSDLRQLLLDPIRSYAYVSDKTNNQIHIFNTATYLIDSSINIGPQPSTMAISEDASLLFVLLAANKQIAILDLATQTVLTPLDLPYEPTAIAIGANKLLYVSMKDTTKPPISIYDVSSLPPTPTGTLSKGSDSIYISGINSARSIIYTHDLTSSSTVTQWDISGSTPVEIQSADIASGPPIIRTSPDEALFIIETNFSIFYSIFGGFVGWQHYDGNVPVHRSSDLLRDGTLNVEWTAIATAISPSGNNILVAHDDTGVNSTIPSAQRHDRDRKDIHIFDVSTYSEVGHYILPEYVKNNGITYNNDGRIFLLLGEGVPGFFGRQVIANSIGVISP